jgi:hypothetical protein
VKLKGAHDKSYINARESSKLTDFRVDFLDLVIRDNKLRNVHLLPPIKFAAFTIFERD